MLDSFLIKKFGVVAWLLISAGLVLGYFGYTMGSSSYESTLTRQECGSVFGGVRDTSKMSLIDQLACSGVKEKIDSEAPIVYLLTIGGVACIGGGIFWGIKRNKKKNVGSDVDVLSQIPQQYIQPQGVQNPQATQFMQSSQTQQNSIQSIQPQPMSQDAQTPYAAPTTPTENFLNKNDYNNHYNDLKQ